MFCETAQPGERNMSGTTAIKVGVSPHVANITVSLGVTPKQEHCQTCHPEGRAVGTPQRPEQATFTGRCATQDMVDSQREGRKIIDVGEIP